uniref:Uncharacterized protein n=1 Tax=Oryza rufipogon TaxID=4529 RepID=A0A0E0NKZ5_ORYRU
MPSPRSRNTLLRRFSNFTGLSPAAVSYSWVRARGDCGSGWNGDADEIDLGRHNEQELTHLDPLSLTLNPLCLTDLKNDQGHIGHNTRDFVC